MVPENIRGLTPRAARTRLSTGKGAAGLPAGPDPDPGAVLTKAVLRAASLLGLSQQALAEVLGVSRPTVTRMGLGGYRLAPSQPKVWELATLFVRMFRSLDALVGHEAAARAWLEGPNTDLGAPPLALITSAEGLVRVVHYLDAHRGRL
jgi:transcriptional regulator with XRE-family HTH domain